MVEKDSNIADHGVIGENYSSRLCELPEGGYDFESACVGCGEPGKPRYLDEEKKEMIGYYCIKCLVELWAEFGAPLSREEILEMHR